MRVVPVSQFDLEGLGEILWPRVVKVRGCTLLEGGFTAASLDTWFEKFDGDVAAVKRMVNHVHLYDLFPRAGLPALRIDAEVFASSISYGCPDGWLGLPFAATCNCQRLAGKRWQHDQ